MRVASVRGKIGRRFHQSFPDGFTLLEIILALAILCGAVAALGELSRAGMRYAEYARNMTQAQLLCESKLAEITAGISLPEAQQAVPFETSGDQTESEWLYSVEVAPLDVDGLVQVRVTVSKDLPARKRPVEFSLVRWMVDQGVELSEASAGSESGSTSPATGGTL